MKWPLVKLGMIADVVSGFGFPRGYQGDKASLVPFFKVGDMNLPENSREMKQWTNTVSANVLKSLKARAFPAGTVIFPKIGAAIATGKKRILTCEATFDNNVMGLVPTKLVDPRFLYYWSLTFDFTMISNIGPVPSIRKTTVESLEFPLPPLSEQRRIAEILDQADALRKKRAEADAKAEHILPALFIRVFGDPTTNQRGWDVFELGDLCAKITSGSRDWARHTGRGDSFFVRTQDINDGEISNGLLTVDPPSGAEADRTRLCYGDVVVTITGIVGKAAVFRVHKQNIYISQDVALVRPKPTLEPEYLAAYTNFPLGNWPLLARFQYGQTKPGLGFRELRTAKIPLPPIDLQRRFVSQTQNIRALKQSRCRAKGNLEELWASLLQRAFSGDLTAKWRETHMNELLVEMENQAKYLVAHGTPSKQENIALQESLF